MKKETHVALVEYIKQISEILKNVQPKLLNNIDVVAYDKAAKELTRCVLQEGITQ